MFAVNDVTFYDVMCIPRGQADGTNRVMYMYQDDVLLITCGARLPHLENFQSIREKKKKLNE